MDTLILECQDYQDKLVSRAALLRHYFNQLVIADCDDKEEVKKVQEVIEQDSILLAQYDDCREGLHKTMLLLEKERSDLQQAAANKAAQRQAQAQAQAVRQSKMKLPELRLPTFDGNVLQWQSFWDSFKTAIHANPDLEGSEK